MKRTILASIIGIAAAMALNSAQAQGHIFLDNYTTLGPYITYGAGFGGMAGTRLTGAQWTIGVYDALGSVSTTPDPSGTADPATLGLALQTGANSTAVLNGPGTFLNTGAFTISGYSSGVVTLELVAFDGSSYGASLLRGHSAAFTMTPATANNTPPPIGIAMPAFSVPGPIPEPSILALTGIGAAALMLNRRKK